MRPRAQVGQTNDEGKAENPKLGQDTLDEVLATGESAKPLAEESTHVLERMVDLFGADYDLAELHKVGM